MARTAAAATAAAAAVWLAALWLAAAAASADAAATAATPDVAAACADDADVTVAATTATAPPLAVVECPPRGRIMVTHRVRAPPGAPPPAAMPPELAPAYTRCGAIPVVPYYVDDTNGGAGIRMRLPRRRIDDAIKRNGALLKRLPPPTGTVDGAARLPKQMWLPWTLARHAADIAGAHCLVVGSNSFTDESMLLALGAAHVTVVEYNELTLDHPAVTTLRSLDAVATASVDVALSISSFDHDGLGRYGDPLAPDGDLLSMDALHRVLRPGGVLFLTVPVGPDAVAWNLHRRYGSVRLPLLLQGWDVVERVAWNATAVTAPAPVAASYEPVFLLRSAAAARSEL